MSRAPHLLKDGSSNVQQGHHNGDDSIRDVVALGRTSKLQPNASVDDADDHEDSAVPDMGVTDESSSLELQVVEVVDVSEDWLKDH